MRNYRKLPAFFLVLAATAMMDRLTAQTATDTQSSQANNLYPNSCGILLEIPEDLARNVDDDQTIDHEDYEKWDLKHSPSEGEDDLREVTITGNAGPTGGTMGLTILSGGEKFNGIFWQDQQKENQQYTLTWPVPPNSSRTVTLYMEGYENSDVRPDINIKAWIDCPAGTGTDGNQYTAAYKETNDESTVWEVDLDVDSNNNNGLDAPDFDETEDEIEASEKPERSGKIVIWTNGDRDKDGVPDFADGIGIAGDGLEAPKLVPVRVKLNKPMQPGETALTFTYASSSPRLDEGIVREGDGTPENPFIYSITQPGLRLWRNNNATRNNQNVPDGDFVPSGVAINWVDLLPSGADETTLYVEYVDLQGVHEGSASQSSGEGVLAWGRTSIEVTATPPGIATDKVNLTLWPLDADLDSDNNQNSEIPARDAREENFQAVPEGANTAQKPGKMLFIHDGDHDYDGLPDYVDGIEDLFREFDTTEEGVPHAGTLIPLLIDLPEAGVTPEKVAVRVRYSASDPKAISREADSLSKVALYKLPEEGRARVWTKNCINSQETRSPEPFADGGDFIDNDTILRTDDLSKLEREETLQCFKLYVEALKPSENMSQEKITLDYGVENEGVIHWSHTEELTLSAIAVQLAAVSADGTTAEHQPGGVAVSHPSPIITMEHFSVSEPELVPSDSPGTEVFQVKVSMRGTIRSALCDTLPETHPAGKITELVLVPNNTEEAAQTYTLPAGNIQKTTDSGNLRRPYPYLGSFDTTANPIIIKDVLNGNNVIRVKAKDGLYQLDGFVDMGVNFDLPELPAPGDPNPPPPEDPPLPPSGPSSSSGFRDFYVSLPPLDPAAADTISAHISGAGVETLLTELVETEADSGIFTDEHGFFTVSIDTERVVDPLKIEIIPVHFLHLPSGINTALLLRETTIDSNAFFMRVTFWSWGNEPDVPPVVVSEPVEIYKTDGGEFHPYVVEVKAPEILANSFSEIGFKDLVGPYAGGGEGNVEVSFSANVTKVRQELFLTSTDEQIAAVLSCREAEEDEWPAVDDGVYLEKTKQIMKKRYVHPDELDKLALGIAAGVGKGGLELVGGIPGAIKVGAQAIYEGGKTIVRSGVFAVTCFVKGALGMEMEEERRQIEEARAKASEKMEAITDFISNGADLTVAVLSGDWDKVQKMSAPLKRLAEMGVEIFQAMKVQFDQAEPYDKGVWIGRGAFEVGTIFFPWAKAAQLAGGVSKAGFFAKLAQSSKFFQQGGGGFQALNTVRASGLEVACALVGGCFTAGTLVWANDGLVPIEQIRKGDLVWSRPEGNPAAVLELRPVAVIYQSAKTDFRVLSYDRNVDGQADGTLKATSEHPFWSNTRRAFLPIAGFEPGERLALADGSEAVALAITAEPGTGQPLATFNLGVTGNHTYFVGHEKIWVHNSCPDDAAKRFLSIVHKELKDANTPMFPASTKLKEAMMLGRAKLLKGGLTGADMRAYARYISARSVDDCANGHGNIQEFPSYKDWERFLGNMKLAETVEDSFEIHHIVPKNVAVLFRDYLNSLPRFQGAGKAFHVDRHLPAHAMTKQLHREISDDMDLDLFKTPLYQTASDQDKMLMVLDFYKENHYDALHEVMKRWMNDVGIPTIAP